MDTNLNYTKHQLHFNEAEWLKLIFLMADTQVWVDDMVKEILRQLPLPDKKKLLRKNYYLCITSLAHILERHYYKIPRYPHTGKFHIPVAEILHHIREAHSLPVTPVNGSSNFQRVIRTEQPIGFDKNGQPASLITILTDAGGKIITAFPGTITNEPASL
ncbi:hypothetical protein [Terrimonas alba]|uniref:hypothetical protein n=1 Tax=Terrimonas alba TaxID=3349636 RepID=UPI0035F2F73B